MPTAQTLRSGSLPLATASRKAAATILSRAQQGYPPRLEALLQAAGVSATVLNFGEGGERTPESLRRIDQVLNQQGRPGDICSSWKGRTISPRRSPSRPPSSTLTRWPAGRKRAALPSFTPPSFLVSPTRGGIPENFMTDDLNGRIRNLAALRKRRETDPYEVFRSTPNLFSGYYVVAEGIR